MAQKRHKVEKKIQIQQTLSQCNQRLGSYFTKFLENYNAAELCGLVAGA
jgi:hypothetical protein